MQDYEKFEGFKKQKLAENEAIYGQELREKYGEDTIDEAHQAWQKMTEKTFKEMQITEKQLLADLTTYLQDQTNQKLALKIFEAHKKWLSFSWPSYSTEAHSRLGLLYVSDKRFASYYDERCGAGATQALHAIIQRYTSM